MNIITCQNCWTQNTKDCSNCPNKSNLEIELKNAKEAERFLVNAGKVFLVIVTTLVIIGLM